MRRHLIITGALVVLASCSGGNSASDATNAAVTTAAGPASSAAGGATAADDTTPAAAAEPSEDPGDFIEDNFKLGIDGRFGQLWDRIHPAQQALVTRSRYIDCQQSQTPASSDLKVKAMDTFTEPIDIPGTNLTNVESTAITVEISLNGQSVRRTVHLVAVDGKWRTMLTSDQLADCPKN